MINKIKKKAIYQLFRKSVKWIKTDKKRKYYIIKGDKLQIIHNSGFFSNCSIALFGIIDFYNKYHKLPSYVDFSQTFNNFKDDINRNVYKKFFNFSENVEIPYTEHTTQHTSLKRMGEEIPRCDSPSNATVYLNTTGEPL